SPGREPGTFSLVASSTSRSATPAPEPDAAGGSATGNLHPLRLQRSLCRCWITHASSRPADASQHTRRSASPAASRSDHPGTVFTTLWRCAMPPHAEHDRIARTWWGWVRTEQAVAYVEYITRTGLSEYE